MQRSSTQYGADGPGVDRFAREVLPLRRELMRFARRYAHNSYDAEDLLQETFVRALAGWGTYTPGTNIRAWMRRIMINVWIGNHRRCERRPKECLTDSFVETRSALHDASRALGPSAEDTVLGRLPDDRLTAITRSLPAHMQRTLFYADICELPMSAIAEIESVPVGTVVSRLHRARHRVRSALQ